MKIRFRSCSTKNSVEFDTTTDNESKMFVPQVSVVVFHIHRNRGDADPVIVSSCGGRFNDEEAIGYAEALQLAVFVFQQTRESDLSRAFGRLKVVRPLDEFIVADCGVPDFPTVH